MTKNFRWMLPAALLGMVAAWGVAWVFIRGTTRTPARGPAGTPPRRVVKIAPPAPARPAAPVVRPDPTESSVLLPLELRLDDIKPLLEAAVPRRFDQTLQLGAHGPAKDLRAVLDLKRGDVTLTPRGDRLAFSFPLTGRIPVKARIDAGIGDGFAAQETIEDVRGVISGWIKLGVDPQWSLTHESDGSFQVEKADVKFPLGITVSVRERLEEQTKGALAKVLREKLDAARDKLQLRERAAGAWARLHTTRSLAGEPSLGVSLQPTAVRLRPLRFDDDGVARAAVAVGVRTAAFAGTPATQPAQTPLPPLVTDGGLGDSLHLSLPVSVPMRPLLDSWCAGMAEKAIPTSGGGTFKPRDVQLWLAGQTAQLAIAFEDLRAEGTMYATGKAAYDPQSQSLRVTELAWDPQTREALQRDAEWLLDPAILQGLEREAVFPLRDKTAKADGAVKAGLAAIAVPVAHLHLDLTARDTTLRQAYPAGESLYLLYDVKGTSRARLELAVPAAAKK